MKTPGDVARAILEDLAAPAPGSEAVILTLSGALSPVHLGHVRCIEAAAECLRAQGKLVVIGCLAPSSSAYVGCKLGSDALSLESRVRLCRLAVGDSQWLHVLSDGIASSLHVCERIVKTLRREIPQLRWVGWQVVGEDFARRAELWSRASADEPYVCIPREGTEGEATGAPPLPPPSAHFVIAPRGSVGEVSSTAIRRLARAGELAACRLIHPAVAAELDRRGWLRAEHGGATPSVSATCSAAPPARATAPSMPAPRTRPTLQAPSSARQRTFVRTTLELLGQLFGHGGPPTPSSRGRHAKPRSVLRVSAPGKVLARLACDDGGVEYTYDEASRRWRPVGRESTPLAERLDATSPQPSSEPQASRERASHEASEAVQARGTEAAAAASRPRAPLLVGISGATRAGKTTLARGLADALRSQGRRCTVVSQDAFFGEGAFRAAEGTRWAGVGNWESPLAVDHERCAAAVARALGAPHADVVLLEGFQAFHDAALRQQMALQLWLDAGEQTVRERRAATTPVPPGYFDALLWPAHLEYRARALAAPGVVRLDGDAQPPAAVLDQALRHVSKASAVTYPTYS